MCNEHKFPASTEGSARHEVSNFGEWVFAGRLNRPRVEVTAAAGVDEDAELSQKKTNH